MSWEKRASQVEPVAARVLLACEGAPLDVAIMALLEVATRLVKRMRASLDNAGALDHLAKIVEAVRKAETGN